LVVLILHAGMLTRGLAFVDEDMGVAATAQDGLVAVLERRLRSGLRAVEKLKREVGTAVSFAETAPM